MLYIEDDILSPRNLSPVMLDLAMVHKPETEAANLPSPSQVTCYSHIYIMLILKHSQVAYRVPFDSSGPNGGFLDGLMGCFRMWTVGKGKSVEIERGNLGCRLVFTF